MGVAFPGGPVVPPPPWEALTVRGSCPAPLLRKAGSLPFQRTIPHYTDIFSLIEADGSLGPVMYSGFNC